MRTREMPNEPEDRTYAELVALLPGGRPAWTVGLSDRATHALVRAGWTLERLQAAAHNGTDLGRIPNVGRKVANEIREWLEVNAK